MTATLNSKNVEEFGRIKRGGEGRGRVHRERREESTVFSPLPPLLLSNLHLPYGLLFLLYPFLRETGRFDTKSFRYELALKLHKNFILFKYSLRVNKKNILDEYSLFFKPNSRRYLLNKLVSNDSYRNDR